MTETRAITVSSTPGDATRAAQEVAAAIRKATGRTVTIGKEYTQALGHKAGMLSVDLTIEDVPAPEPTPSPIQKAHDDYIRERLEGPVAQMAPPPDAMAVLDAIAVTDFAALSTLVPSNNGSDLSLGPDSVTEEDAAATPTTSSEKIRSRKRR